MSETIKDPETGATYDVTTAESAVMAATKSVTACLCPYCGNALDVAVRMAITQADGVVEDMKRKTLEDAIARRDALVEKTKAEFQKQTIVTNSSPRQSDWRCPCCGKVWGKGSVFDKRMAAFVCPCGGHVAADRDFVLAMQDVEGDK